MKKIIKNLKSLICCFGLKKGIFFWLLRYIKRIEYHREMIRFLERDFAEIINCYKKKKEKQNLEKSDYIWILWYQGYESMPELIKKCYNSICLGFSDKKVILLNKDNIGNYISVSQAIRKKFEAGKISITHFSDIVRANVLYLYGGCWIDSTCYVFGQPPRQIWEKEFYTQKMEKQKSHFFNYGRWSVFFLYCRPEHIIAAFLKDFFELYWNRYNEVADYFLMDYILCVGYRNIDSIKKTIDKVPYNNQDVMFISENWNKKYKKSELEKKMKNNWFFKLSWKKKIKKGRLSGMFFKCIEE